MRLSHSPVGALGVQFLFECAARRGGVGVIPAIISFVSLTP
jgi:hypothetical protein